MKGTKVQTLGAVAGAWPVASMLGCVVIIVKRMRTANRWAGPRNAVRDLAHASYLSQASCVIVSAFRVALDLDTYPLRNLIHPRFAERAKPGRGKPVLIMHIGAFACFHAISLKRSRFSKIATLISCPCSTEVVGIAHRPPRSL